MSQKDLEDLLNQKQTLNEIVRIIRNGDLSTMTPKMVKRQLEMKLDLEENILDQLPWKRKMKELINEAQNIYDQNPKASDDEQMSSTEHTTAEHSNEASDADEKVVKKRKANRKTSSKVPDSDSGSRSSDNSSAISDDDVRPVKKRKGTKAVTSKTSKTSEQGSKSDETIKRLKSYISKCGVRKIWSKELADCDTASSQIARLKSILQDLGVHGRPTLEKCEKVKSERELKAEIDSLSTENIITTDKRRTRSVVPAEYLAEDNTEEIEEAKKNDLDLGFLGDQSSDSD